MENEIKSQLKVEMKAQGYTYKTFSKKVGIEPQALYYTLSNKSKITIERMDKIVNALGIDAEIKIKNTTIKI